MSANKHNIASLSERLANLHDTYKADVEGVIEDAKKVEVEPAALRRLVSWKRVPSVKRAEREAIDDQYRFLAGELPTPATLPPDSELATAVRLFNDDMSVRQVAEEMEISVGKAHKLKTQAAAFKGSVHVQMNMNTPKVREMVADDIGQWLPPHDHNTGEIIETVVSVVTRDVTPRAILPSPSAWASITTVREAHHAAIEAAREAKREARRREMEQLNKLAALTDDDMPDQPAFLRRRVG
jgi:uncharacterized protein (UPF0335 family)